MRNKIVEPIGHHWRDELVWLDAPSADATRVVDVRSGSPLPSQRAGIDPREAGKGRHQVCVRVDLKPDEELELAVERGDAGRIANPITIESGATFFTIGNGRISVRVPVSASFDPGHAAGPILAAKRAADERWIGQGKWGPSAFLGRIETTIIDRGPLYARWITQYIVGGREVAAFDARMVAGEDFLIVHDRSIDDTKASFRFSITGTDAPTHWTSYGGGEAKNAVSKPLTDPPNKYGSRREDEILHIDFHSGHQQMSLTWAGFWREAGDGPLVGVSEMHASQWINAGRNRIRALKEGSDGLAWEFPTDGGAKAYALCIGDPTDYGPATGLSRFCHIRRKYSDIPLEKVRHWITHVEPRKYERPITYPKGTVENYETTLAAWPELAAKYKEVAKIVATDRDLSGAILPTYLATRDESVKKHLIGVIDHAFDYTINDVLSNGYLKLIIFHGRMIKVALEDLDVLRWLGDLDEASQRKWLRRAAFAGYCFADQDFWPYDTFFRTKGDPRGQGDEYWDNIGDAICPPNFTTEYFSTLGVIGAAYPEHPMSRAWMETSAALFESNLESQFYESGAYSESLNYTDHELHMLLQLAIALWAAGVRDFFEHPRFKKTFGYFIDSMTPPVSMTPEGRKMVNTPSHLKPAGDGRAVMITNWGNSGWDCSGMPVPVLLPAAAGIYADRDPEYAKRLMSAWRTSPQRVASHYGGLYVLAFARPDLPDIDLKQQSKLIEGLGAVMRGAVGTPREVFAWTKNSPATHHNCRDEGGMVLYAHGAPITGDLGYHCVHGDKQHASACETWKHNCVTFGGETMSMFQNCEYALPPESWRSTPESDLLVSYLPVDRFVREGGAFFYPTMIPRIDYRRLTFFVKPHYFVVYDHIPKSTQPSTYWMHALADSIEISAQRATFRGTYGVDLHLQVLLPAPAKISQGRFSMRPHVRIDQPGAGDYLTVFCALPRGEKPPVAEFDSTKSVVRVEGAWGIDRVYINAADKCIKLDRG